MNPYSPFEWDKIAMIAATVIAGLRFLAGDGVRVSNYPNVVMSRNAISDRNSDNLLRIPISEFVALQRIFAKIN
jgi:hypothetical protein